MSLSTPMIATLTAWALVEFGLRVRSRRQGHPSRSEWSVYFIFAGVGLSSALAGAVAARHAAPIAGAWAGAVGLVLVWAGVAFRLWAILTLGRFFKFAVVIQDDHRVVEQGPYAWLRHPSYAGALVALVGIGLARGDWVGTAVMLVGPLAVFLVRIAVEERALREALGEPYAGYAARTRRLLPGVW